MRIGLVAACIVSTMGVFAVRDAAACSQLCASSERFATFEVISTAIARDGVVAFDWSRGSAVELSLAEALAFVAVEVVDARGDVVPGVLEWREWADAIVWAPENELTTSEPYTLVLTVDNTGLQGSDGWERCGPDIERSTPLTVGDSLPASPPVEATISTEHSYTSVRDLHHLVCCDGAMPSSAFSCVSEEVRWNEGHCESTVQLGRLTVAWALAWAAGPEVAANYAPRFTSDHGTLFGSPAATSLASRHHVESLCGAFELVSLVDGSVVAREEGCFGEELADMLGLVEIDPTPGLAVCSTEPYVCAVESEGGPYGDSRWDPDQCEPWPGGDDGDSGDGDGDGGDDGSDGGSDDGPGGDGGHDGGHDGGIADRGCGCTSAPAMPAGMSLALFALALSRRRRRSER